MLHFHKISQKRLKTEESKNLTTLPRSYTYYLGLFVICDRFVHR